MIKSIKFTGEKGYIVHKIPEPDCNVRNFERSFDRLSPEEQEEVIRYKKEYKKWKKHKDDPRYPELIKNLVNRKIEFSDKINLIFGPNASGKTTILKALGGYAGTTDGYARILEPLQFRNFFSEVSMESHLFDLMKNTAEIEWDGSPVYYDNFSSRKSYGQIGDMVGSVLSNIGDEVSYLMGKDKRSLGENSIFLLNRLLRIAENQTNYSEIFKDYLEDGKIKDNYGNETWTEVIKAQLNYFLSLEKSYIKSPSTFLFDELDKSLDVLNISYLYNTLLPGFLKKTGVQIIIISHSPLVLSEKIRKNDLYNFISIDEDYTQKCLEELEKLF